jgi:hypothetical protein
MLISRSPTTQLAPSDATNVGGQWHKPDQVFAKQVRARSCGPRVRAPGKAPLKRSNPLPEDGLLVKAVDFKATKIEA